MNELKLAFSTLYQIANITINLYGYQITLWQIFLFAAFGSLIIWFIVKFSE